ncbi:MAG: DNA helicase II [Pseudomonadota bacterium]|nr:DNA helicase II [Pseudomonadota bacterium]
MNPLNSISDLNEQQLLAVESNANHTLVLAGAGSGKTKVLTHRIAWCIETGQVRPDCILAVTFTNKAAKEMQGRIQSLIEIPLNRMWVGTFHGIAHRLLRIHYKIANLSPQFQIIDKEDQLRVIKRILKELDLSDKECDPKEIQIRINFWKEDGIRPEKVQLYGDSNDEIALQVYKEYEGICKKSSLVDFSELLLRVYEIFSQDASILASYRTRFQHILVDEFQDTNKLQYKWLNLLASQANNFFVVGDDDQSIYSWRGARVENMQNFRKHYPGYNLIRLEQNYRSSSNILTAANALISNNSSRIGKNLWTNKEKGQPLKLYSAYNELDEARYVVDTIDSEVVMDDQFKLTDCAILYRVSAQSRVLEDALRLKGIQYRVYGGFRFYDRAEIKDILAYLRLTFSRKDDAAFERVINFPPRGLGDKALATIRSAAKSYNLSLFDSAEMLIKDKEIPNRTLNALTGFLKIINHLETYTVTDNDSLSELIEVISLKSGLVEYFQKEKGGRGVDRIENINELIMAAKDFDNDEESEILESFLTRAALESGEAQASENTDCVQLMTIHSAKGLEFKFVFILGLEEGLFPHKRSIGSLEQLQEERRLCYVGITRAQEYLCLTHAESRRLHGAEYMTSLSRFVKELPESTVEHVRIGGSFIDFSNEVKPTSTHDYQLGQPVEHNVFGCGIILAIEGRGESLRLQVNFENSGIKWMVASYAGLKKI